MPPWTISMILTQTRWMFFMLSRRGYVRLAGLAALITLLLFLTSCYVADPQIDIVDWIRQGELISMW